jgi:hypothetical protein
MTDVLTQCVGEGYRRCEQSHSGAVQKNSALTKCTILPFGILLHCNLGRDSWIARRRNTP